MNNASKELGELFKALAKTQGAMDIAHKDQVNPFYKSKYASFTSIIKASRPYLTENGISITQREEIIESGQLVLNTIMTHTSGQWMGSMAPIKPTKNDIQSKGSYMTYLQRYSYKALVGVITNDDDDDGEAAMGSNRNSYSPPQQQYKKKDLTAVITEEQLEQLEYELEDELDLAQEILDKMNLKTLKEMPKHKFMNSIKRIREIKKTKNASS